MNESTDGTAGSDLPSGYVLPLALIAAFRAVITDLHHHLARHGHPDSRPIHGFALQAVGSDGPTVAELGRRLGVTKQAAAKTASSLERLGYVIAGASRSDRRATALFRTDRGGEFLRLSEEFFQAQGAAWTHVLGRGRLTALVQDLHTIAGDTPIGDLPGWLT